MTLLLLLLRVVVRRNALAMMEAMPQKVLRKQNNSVRSKS